MNIVMALTVPTPRLQRSLSLSFTIYVPESKQSKILKSYVGGKLTPPKTRASFMAFSADYWHSKQTSSDDSGFVSMYEAFLRSLFENCIHLNATFLHYNYFFHTLSVLPEEPHKLWFPPRHPHVRSHLG